MTENVSGSRSDSFFRLEGITKTFPGVKALSAVSFDLRAGEVHALCGENGAGKSTLIKVMTGAHKKDSGNIVIDNEEVEFVNTHQAIEMGISCVYQELSIVPLLDVARNLFIGNLPRKGRVIDYKKLYADTADILEKLGLTISPHEKAGELSVGQQQMIEIGRALTRKARCIIMDEPTSSLSERETDTLFEIIEKLKNQNIAVVYISHKLDEVMHIADRVTVIRDGQHIISKDISDITEEQIISKMIGRDLKNMYCKEPGEPKGIALAVKGLTKHGVFEDISFEVHAGEILGFFGLVGAGRSEIMRAVFGADKYDSGQVIINGKTLKPGSPARSIVSGMGFVTEDRKQEGLMLELSVLANMTLPKLKDLSSGGVIRRKAQREITQKYIDSIRIKTPTMNQLAVNLSGGNQQKIVIAKWLMMDPKVLIVDEPTRGIDVGSKAEIYALMNELAKRGVAIIVVSSEIEEVMGLSDNVITIFEGRKTAKLKVTSSLTREEILAASIGGVTEKCN